MPPEIQQENPQLEDADLRAALGYANNILSQTIPPDEMEQGETGEEAPQVPETAPTSPVEPEVEETPAEEENIGLEAIQEAVRTAVQEEMKGLKKDIEKVINEDENKN